MGHRPCKAHTIRVYFKRWKPKTHCLRYIFPSSGKDEESVRMVLGLKRSKYTLMVCVYDECCGP